MAYLSTTSPALSTVNPNAPISERAIYMVTREYGYFDKYWLPKLRGASGKVTKALYRHVSFNPTKWIKAGMAIPKYTTIAADAGVSRATVTRVLHRATPQDIARWDNEEMQRQMENPAYAPRPCPFAVGDFAYTYQGEWLGGYIQRFIRRIENRWRFDKLKGHSVQTSNHYDLSHILPPIPEHDGLVQIAIKDILAQDAAKLAQKNEPHNADSKEDSLRDRKMNPESVVLKTNKRDNGSRSLEGETQGTSYAANHTISSTNTGTGTPPSPITTTYESASNAGSVSPSYSSATLSPPAARASGARSGNRKYDEQPPKFAVVDAQRQPQTHEESDRKKDAFLALCQIEAFFGSSFPDTVAKSLVRDMEVAGTPYEMMSKLISHAEERMSQRMSHGDPVDPKCYFPGVVRGMLGEMQAAEWDLEQVVAVDQGRWEQSTVEKEQFPSRRRGKKRSQSSGYSDPMAPPRRRSSEFSHSPSPSYGSYGVSQSDVGRLSRYGR